MSGQLQDCSGAEKLLSLLFGARFHSDQELSRDVVHRHLHGFLAGPAVFHSSSHVPCSVHDVSTHGAGCGKLARAAAVEHGVAQHISVHKDRVEHIIDAVKRIFIVHQEGRHHCIAAFRQIFAGGEELDLSVDRPRVIHILRRDPGDAFRVDFFIIDEFPIGQGGKDGDLAAGVVAFHIGGGVCLGIAFLLRFLKNFVKVGAFHIHLVQHVVGGPVQDARDLRDLVGRQGSVDGADDGNAAAAAGFEQIVDVLFRRDLHQLPAVLRHQGFVGGADAFPGQQGCLGELIGRAGPAHDLGDDPDFRVFQDHVEIVNQDFFHRISREIPKVKHILDLKFTSGVAPDAFFVGVDHFENT